MDQMRNKRVPTPAQKIAKNKRDSARRENHKNEFKRLQNAVAEQRKENGHLREENKKQNARISDLEKTIRKLRHTIDQLSHQNLELQETLKLADSWFEYDKCCPNEEVANDEPITQCPESSQIAIQYSDELVEDFIKKFDAKEKSNLDFSDFDGLKEELRTSGINNLPPSLASFDSSIKETFGEIAADSTQSSCTAMPSRILFCAAIREMCNLQLHQIDERKILLWRDAINSALNINFKVEFAMIHLKKIAHAYFGLKAWCEQVNDPELKSIVERISELVIEQRAWEAKHAQKLEDWNSEMRKQCVRDAEFFGGKSLSTGLFH